MLTLIYKLEHDSDLQNQLGNLALFNFLCRINVETANIDYKHILTDRAIGIGEDFYSQSKVISFRD